MKGWRETHPRWPLRQVRVSVVFCFPTKIAVQLQELHWVLETASYTPQRSVVAYCFGKYHEH